MRVGRLTWPTSRLGRFCCIRATFAWRFTASATSETKGLFRPSRQTRYLLIYKSSFVTSFRQSPTPIHQNISENSGTGVFPHFGRRSSPKGGSFTRDRANANKEMFVDMVFFAPPALGTICFENSLISFLAHVQVTWLSPPDADSYFNILVLHQVQNTVHK